MSGQKCPMGCLGHGGAGVCPHCGDWHQDDFSCCAPTPVPSEVAETTAGEREVEAGRVEHDAGWCWCEGWHGPAALRILSEPGAGEVEALAAKWDAASVAARKSEHHWPADCLAEAAEMLRRQPALLDRVRREEGERIAQAIEAEGVNGMPHLFGRAAAIARAASVGPTD